MKKGLAIHKSLGMAIRHLFYFRKEYETIKLNYDKINKDTSQYTQ